MTDSIGRDLIDRANYLKELDLERLKSTIQFKKIHEDERGEIVCFYLAGQEYTILTTRSVFARGGCVHKDHDEKAIVLAGKVKYFIGDSKAIFLNEMGTVLIPKNVPHYFFAIQDSMTLEWGATPEEKDCKDIDMRNVVNGINDYAKFYYNQIRLGRR